MEINISLSSTVDAFDKAAKSVRRKLKIKPSSYTSGLCAVSSYLLWLELGKPKDWQLVSVLVGEEEHVILYNKKEKTYYDMTADQFDYENGFTDNWDRRYTDREKISTQDLKFIEDETNDYLNIIKAQK